MTTTCHNLCIRAEGLEKRYGHIRALNGVDLSIRAGESWSIFGPNGAGKTTLIGILSMFIKPTGGELRIEGTGIEDDQTALRRRIGVISHQTFLSGDLTAYENLLFFGRLYGISDLKNRARSIISKVGLKDRAGERVRTFSRGMQQRLSIARALIHEPSILLLDEPFTGLDPVGVKLFQDMLNLFRSEHRLIVMTSHNISLGTEDSTHILILADGRVVFSAARTDMKNENLEDIYLRHAGR